MATKVAITETAGTATNEVVEDPNVQPRMEDAAQEESHDKWSGPPPNNAFQHRRTSEVNFLQRA